MSPPWHLQKSIVRRAELMCLCVQGCPGVVHYQTAVINDHSGRRLWHFENHARRARNTSYCLRVHIATHTSAEVRCQGCLNGVVARARPADRVSYCLRFAHPAEALQGLQTALRGAPSRGTAPLPPPPMSGSSVR